MRFAPKLAIFDLDGTLIEFHREYLFSQTQSVIESLSHPPVPLAELEQHFAAFDYFAFVQPDRRDGFVEQFWSRFDWAGFPKPRPIPGAVSTLAALRERGIDIAIATSRFVNSELLREELRETGLLSYVSLIISRGNDHIHWTDKTNLIRQVCASLQHDLKRTMMIGDIPTDISSAKQAGVGVTVAVRTGGILEDVLQGVGPDLLVSSVSEILDHIEPC